MTGTSGTVGSTLSRSRPAFSTHTRSGVMKIAASELTEYGVDVVLAVNGGAFVGFVGDEEDNFLDAMLASVRVVIVAYAKLILLILLPEYLYCYY